MDSMLCQRLLLCRRKIIIFFYFDSDMVNFIDLFLFLLFIIILSKITIISLYISGWPGILWYIRLVLNRNLLTAYLKGTGIYCHYTLLKGLCVSVSMWWVCAHECRCRVQSRQILLELQF